MSELQLKGTFLRCMTQSLDYAAITLMMPQEGQDNNKEERYLLIAVHSCFTTSLE